MREATSNSGWRLSASPFRFSPDLADRWAGRSSATNHSRINHSTDHQAKSAAIQSHASLTPRILQIPSPARAAVSDMLTVAQALKFPALQLFAGSAASRTKELEITDDNVALAAEICGCLDVK